MKQVLILPSFERSVKRLTTLEKKALGKSLETFNSFLVSGHLPHGFRLKKIGPDHYEFRIDIRLRVILKSEPGVYYLVLVGNHNEVRRYLLSS